MDHAYAIVMAGGAGTRFWPASRETRPKQLLPLGKNSEVLLSATVRRLEGVIPMDRVYIATNRRIDEAVRALLPGIPAQQVLAEPSPRNTAPCIAWATAQILARDKDAVVAVLPSDQTIEDEAAFSRSLRAALESGAGGAITTVGIVPTRPETGFGYVEVGDAVSKDVKRVARFVEKPNLETAKAYLAGRKHLWNAGMFFFRAKAMMDAIRKHMPELAKGLDEIMNAPSGREGEVLDRVFPALPSVSIDYGIMEKETGLHVVPGDFGWSDLGSWESAWELAEKDASENALDDGTVAIDSKGLLVKNLASKGTKKKIVSLVGVQDLVVVETDDAILVMPRSRAQDVRLVVEALKARGEKHLL